MDFAAQCCGDIQRIAYLEPKADQVQYGTGCPGIFSYPCDCDKTKKGAFRYDLENNANSTDSSDDGKIILECTHHELYLEARRTSRLPLTIDQGSERDYRFVDNLWTYTVYTGETPG